MFLLLFARIILVDSSEFSYKIDATPMPSIYRSTESLLRLQAVQRALEAVSACSGCIAICQRFSNVWGEIQVCGVCGNIWQSKRIGWDFIENEVQVKMFAALTKVVSCIEEAQQQDVDLP